MRSITVALPFTSDPFFEKALLFFTRSGLVARVIVIHGEPLRLKTPGIHVLQAPPLSSGETLNLILEEVRTDYLLLFPEVASVLIRPQALERWIEVGNSTQAGLVYSDFYDEHENQKAIHPLNDYQPGSVRDDFDFGAMILFSVSAIRDTVRKYGPAPEVKTAGLYDLRLKLSIDHSIHHLQEPLYGVIGHVGAIHACTPKCVSARRHELPLQNKTFSYVDPRNRAIQKESEAVFTDYLKKIGAYLPSRFKEVPRATESFPAEASIVIPVRNRKETISDAVTSALSQDADFPFNVIVVDNHSTDGTTAVLSSLAGRYPAIRHIVPGRTDLGIGGCWNDALGNEACGRYAVQLDSDDLYSSNKTLRKMVDMLRQEKFGMVIGSYTLVDFDLKEIPPGLIDHREWTDENGHNNALRINGLGAPRAFDTGLMRNIGFLNVSYGEDYAAALRICREYRIGRIYESLYLCRRWPGNTDAGLGIEEVNRNHAFKDRIRTQEIGFRQKANQSR
jgi:hypothetical protein